MWEKNQGKCGVCGDPYHEKVQPHMDGGMYARGIITKTYRKGQIINVAAKLTMSHKGYFQFRIGAFDNSRTEGDETGRLKGQLLELTTGGTKFNITKMGHHDYHMQLKLPPQLTCQRCVLQWWYRGGNNWGCEKGECGQGFGPQETFVNCADVRITG